MPPGPCSPPPPEGTDFFSGISHIIASVVSIKPGDRGRVLQGRAGRLARNGSCRRRYIDSDGSTATDANLTDSRSEAGRILRE